MEYQNSCLIWDKIRKDFPMNASISRNARPKKQKTAILQDISGVVKSGEILAIMGVSGSGKTSLLNILGGRNLGGVTGKVYINGHMYQKALRKKIAFVPQEDVFHPSPSYTLLDQLQFTAMLRLPATMTPEDKGQRIQRLVDALNLKSCAHQPLALISGGERRRCSIATELLTDPMVVLIDEGTSGLDSASVAIFMESLQRIAESGRPVAMAIHQPSSRMFHSFSKILLLADGKCAYYGRPGDCMAYCHSIGYSMLPGLEAYNPAEFVLEVLFTKSSRDVFIHKWSLRASEVTTEVSGVLSMVSVNLSSNQSGDHDETSSVTSPIATLDPTPPHAFVIECEESTHGAPVVPPEVIDDSIESEYREQLARIRANPETPRPKQRKYAATYTTQLVMLFARSFKAAMTTGFNAVGITQSLVIGCMIGLCWYQTKVVEARIYDITGFIFFVNAFWFFSGLYNGITEFLPERAILKKERESGMYHLSTYVLAKSIASSPMSIMLPAMCFSVAYALAICSKDVQPNIFLSQLALVVISSLLGESIGLSIGTLPVDLSTAMSLSTIVLLVMMLLGGFYTRLLPAFLKTLQYTSPMRYIYETGVAMEFSWRRRIPCSGGVITHWCSGTDSIPGAQWAQMLDVVSRPIEVNFSILLAMMVGWRCLAYWNLRYLPQHQQSSSRK